MSERTAARAARFAAAVGLALAVGGSAAAGQTIRGILIEDGTERAIPLGQVVMLDEDNDTVAAVLSDDNGVFTVTASKSGSYRVVGRALGYVGRGVGPFDMEKDELRVVQLVLPLAPVPIEGVDVSARPLTISDDALLMNGFYDRMRQGVGQFLTPEDIAASTVRYTPQLFDTLNHVLPAYDEAPWKRWVPFMNPFGAKPCRPRVWVDGIWINKPRFELFGVGWGLTDAVPKNTIKAIEVYWGLSGPPQYAAPNASDRGECGVILIWTYLGR